MGTRGLLLLSAAALIAAACAAEDGDDDNLAGDGSPPDGSPPQAPNIRVEYSIGEDEMPEVSVIECPAGDTVMEVCWGDGECSESSGTLHHRYEPPAAGTPADHIETHTAEVSYRGGLFEISIEWGDYDVMRCWATGNAGAAEPVGKSFGDCAKSDSLPLEACASGISCGESYCSPGLECCNALCGICVEPGLSCDQGC